MVQINHPEFGPVEATDLNFDSPEEEWRDYELEDGATLKVKTVVNKVFRIEGEYNELGEPIYNISTQNMVRATDIPDDLRGETMMNHPTDQYVLAEDTEDSPDEDGGDE